jgi:cobaltochelatase CobN
VWRSLNVPILQVILAGSSKEQWQAQSIGLSPRDLAMNVVLPEVDGRIITRAISFKANLATNQKLETDVVVYEPVRDRVEFVADLAANWLKLKKNRRRSQNCPDPSQLPHPQRSVSQWRGVGYPC